MLVLSVFSGRLRAYEAVLGGAPWVRGAVGLQVLRGAGGDDIPEEPAAGGIVAPVSLVRILLHDRRVPAVLGEGYRVVAGEHDLHALATGVLAAVEVHLVAGAGCYDVELHSVNPFLCGSGAPPRLAYIQCISCGRTCKAVWHVRGKGHSLYYPLLGVLHFVVLAIHISLEILTNLANIFPVLGVLLVGARPAHDDRTSHF